MDLQPVRYYEFILDRIPKSIDECMSQLARAWINLAALCRQEGVIHARPFFQDGTPGPRINPTVGIGEGFFELIYSNQDHHPQFRGCYPEHLMLYPSPMPSPPTPGADPREGGPSEDPPPIKVSLTEIIKVLDWIEEHSRRLASRPDPLKIIREFDKLPLSEIERLARSTSGHEPDANTED